jgi:apolipoprotein N-acyltransferase
VPGQEVAADRVQAVEEGRDLVQAAPTGFSTVVDDRGDVIERTDLGRRQILLATVGLRTGRTVYERTGDRPVLVLAGLAVLAGWLLAARWRRKPEIVEP